jgi:glycosyltransferase involved in cell wall biosynthesis
MKIVYLVHGYPPYENAGTEQHCKLLVEGLHHLGHDTYVISATRSIGKNHAVVIREGKVIRIVNNIPARPLAQAEKEQSIAKIVEREISRIQPDIVHVHHIQFLSSSIRFSVPSVFTFHDAWLWCTAGGTMIYPNGKVCQKVDPQQCVECYRNWQPIPTKTATLLMKIATKINPIISATQLHSFWRRVPSYIRNPIARNSISEKTESIVHAEDRNKELLLFAEQFDELISPSQYLSDKAKENGLSPITIIRHGVEQFREHIGGEGFVFLGTMEPHKGPNIIADAYDIAFPDKRIPIRFYGDGSCRVNHPMFEAVPRKEVWNILQRADALCIGSIWPENAPMIISEARAVGCPIIAPNIGGIPELIQNDVDGFLYKPGDVLDCASKILKILDTPLSPTPPKSLEENINEYEKVYQRLVLR